MYVGICMARMNRDKSGSNNDLADEGTELVKHELLQNKTNGRAEKDLSINRQICQSIGRLSERGEQHWWGLDHRLAPSSLVSPVSFRFPTHTNVTEINNLEGKKSIYCARYFIFFNINNFMFMCETTNRQICITFSMALVC